MTLVSLHHEEQKLIARNVVAELAPLWLILDFHDLRGTTAPWLKAIRPVIERGYLTSQYVAAEFVKNYRRVELPDSDQLEVDVPNPLGTFSDIPIPDRQVQVKIMVSMQVTGPVWMASNSFDGMTYSDMQDIKQRGFSKSTGAATRLVLNGGRGMVRMLVDADEMARGIAGVADDDSCESCKFLTKPIMKSDGKRKMNAVAVGHDFCTCSAKPVY